MDEFVSVAGEAREHGVKPWAFALADQNPLAHAELLVTRRAYVTFIAGQGPGD